MAKTLARCKDQFAAFDLTDQARVIKSSANIALPPEKPIRKDFWATVMQAPADINTPSSNPPKRKLAKSTQDSTNPTASQTRARNDFWEIVMRTSENKPSSEKVLRNNSSGITTRKANSISQKKHSRKELLVATVQNCAISTSSRKRPRRDFWALSSE